MVSAAPAGPAACVAYLSPKSQVGCGAAPQHRTGLWG